MSWDEVCRIGSRQTYGSSERASRCHQVHQVLRMGGPLDPTNHRCQGEGTFVDGQITYQLCPILRDLDFGTHSRLRHLLSSYIWVGNQLTVSVAFTAISLFAMVRAPLNVIPTWIVFMMQTKVALDHIQGYIDDDEVDGQVSSLKEDTGRRSNQERLIRRGVFQLGPRNFSSQVVISWVRPGCSINDPSLQLIPPLSGSGCEIMIASWMDIV